MVLESIIRPSTATRHPWEMFFFGILAASAALLLGYWVFPDEADMVLVFFTVMACIPVMFHAIRNEEKKEGIDERALLKEHGRVISFFLFLFLGITLAFVAWYIFLPNEISTTVFQQQLSTIDKINNPAGQAASLDYFSRIFLNNMKVMTFSILFAFFYGAGAIFILTWNASVIAAAIGSMISGLQGQSGVMLSGAYAISRYFIHGLPEMAAYMVAGLAGGIISVAIIRHDYRTKKFEKILLDATNLVLISISILLFAAIVETMITPLLFY